MNTSVTYAPTPDTLALRANDIHIWTVNLKRPCPAIGRGPLLSGDERTRARRFVFDRDRHAFERARGALRMTLARYLDIEPARIEFDYNAHGKPSLKPAIKTPAVCFNLSHSGDLALIAITRSTHVGIDIERLRPDLATMKLARTAFSPAEVTALSALPRELFVRGFYHCWTRKEAFIKAVGEGLSFPLDAFDVSLRPDSPAELLALRAGTGKACDWMMYDLTIRPGYVGAVVLGSRDRDWQVRHFDH